MLSPAKKLNLGLVFVAPVDIAFIPQICGSGEELESLALNCIPPIRSSIAIEVSFLNKINSAPVVLSTVAVPVTVAPADVVSNFLELS